MVFMKVDPFYDFGGRGCLGAGCGGGRLAGVPGRQRGGAAGRSRSCRGHAWTRFASGGAVELAPGAQSVGGGCVDVRGDGGCLVAVVVVAVVAVAVVVVAVAVAAAAVVVADALVLDFRRQVRVVFARSRRNRHLH